jgi:hypothetical protein
MYPSGGFGRGIIRSRFQFAVNFATLYHKFYNSDNPYQNSFPLKELYLQERAEIGFVKFVGKVGNLPQKTLTVWQ